MFCMWGMGPVGETVTETIRRESHLPSQTRSSGCSPLVFTLHYFREKSGHPGKKETWCPEILSPIIQPPAFSILVLAEKGTAFPNVVASFPFRSASRWGGNVHLSGRAPIYLYFALGDLICWGRPHRDLCSTISLKGAAQVRLWKLWKVELLSQVLRNIMCKLVGHGRSFLQIPYFCPGSGIFWIEAVDL